MSGSVEEERSMLVDLIAHVNQLPPEILIKIFVAFRSQPLTTKKEAAIQLLVLTSICRYWRATAIGCAYLWSDILFVNAPFAELMLRRSRDSPLSIDFSGSPSQGAFGGILLKILSQTYRLRKVSLSNTSQVGDYNTQSFLSSWTTGLPVLEELFLDASASWEEISPIILQSNAPHLKSLHLKGYSISSWGWRLSEFASRLVHLWLQPSDDARRVSSLEGLISSLASMSELQSLTMKRLLPLRTDLRTDPHHDLTDLGPRTTTLHRLRVLDIQDPSHCIRAFCQSIQTPRIEDLRVGYDDYQDLHIFEHLPEYVPPCSSGPISGGIRNVSVRHTPSRYYYGSRNEPVFLSFLLQVDRAGEQSSSHTFTFSIASPLASILAAMDTNMQLTPLSEVEINMFPDFYPWTGAYTLLQDLPSIHTLTFIGTAPIGPLLAALEATRKEGDQIAFPALTTVKFVRQQTTNLTTLGKLTLLL